MPQTHAAGKRPEVEDDPSGDNEPKLTSSKRQKRGKYVSKACDQCQQRKIKCDGSLPCAPCALSRRYCGKRTTDMRRRSARTQAEAGRDHSTMLRGQNISDNNQPTIRELSARIYQLERLVHSKLQTSVPNWGRYERSESEANPEPAPLLDMSWEETCVTTTPRHERLAHVQPTTFSGETSIRYTLNQLEGDLARSGEKHEPSIADTQSQLSTPTLTPSPSPGGGVASCMAPDIHKVLQRYGVEASKPHWDGFLYTFCDGIHTMYPFLHLPSLWRQYTELWDTWFSETLNPGLLGGRDEQITVAQLFICLAIGRCTASPRVASAEARHSAGWSLYGAATDLFGDILSSFEECSNQVLVLQTLALMVVYLFRLDIIGKAEKLLALAISHAHHLGFHRCKIIMAGRTQSETEICRRLWWCLFIMDRRIAIETGRPFLIQDLNLDTSLPQELHDDYFHYHQADLNCSPGSALQTEIPTSVVTPIPYLTAMVTYSRVLGKVWEGIYSAKNTETPPSPHLCEHLEHLISRAQKDIPREFIYNPWQQQAQPKPSVWWLARQQTLMRVRWLSLRLLIRRPMLQETSSFLANQLAGVENELISVQIAHELIKQCLEIPLEQAVFTYPFLHYLISATIVFIALIIKEPTYKDSHGDVTLHVIEVLEAYCQRTWVSGKLIRTVLKLSQITSRVLAGSNRAYEKHASCLFAGENCALTELKGSHRYFPTAQLGFKHYEIPTPLVRQTENQQAGGSAKTSSEQHHEPVQNDVVDSQNPGPSDAAPPYAQFAGLTNLEADFYFEENITRRATPSQPLAHVEAPSTQQPLPGEQGVTADSEGDIHCGSLGDSTSRAPAGRQSNIADPGEGVAREMYWLEALFGSYLDSDLIIRPGE